MNSSDTTTLTLQMFEKIKVAKLTKEAKFIAQIITAVRTYEREQDRSIQEWSDDELLQFASVINTCVKGMVTTGAKH